MISTSTSATTSRGMSRDHPVCIDPKDPSKYNCKSPRLRALLDHVFRNDGGRFVDVTAAAGLVDRDGRGLGVVAADLDGDRRATSTLPTTRRPTISFTTWAGFGSRREPLGNAGAAASANGYFQAGMGGVACGDLEGDGRLHLAVNNFYNESTSFFRNLGGGFYSDAGDAIGLAAPSRYLLGWGIAFPDVNNDGQLDLLSANGHIYDGRPQPPFTMPLQLLVGSSDGKTDRRLSRRPVLRSAPCIWAGGSPRATLPATAGWMP